jgi:hypothetical protein
MLAPSTQATRVFGSPGSIAMSPTLKSLSAPPPGKTFSLSKVGEALVAFIDR